MCGPEYRARQVPQCRVLSWNQASAHQEVLSRYPHVSSADPCLFDRLRLPRALPIAVLSSLIFVGTLASAWAADTNLFDLKPARKTPSLFADRVVARGRGFEVTRSQVDEAFTTYKASAAVQGQVIPESRRADVEKQVLERLINVQLLLTKATEADHAKAKIAAEKAFDEYAKRVPDEADFRRRILAFGMTIDQFKARLLEEALFREVIDREIRSKITLSTEQAREFYLKNAAQYDEPEKIRAGHIVLLLEDPKTRTPLPEDQKLAKKQLAEKLLVRLKAGEDFGKLAQEFSDDPNTRDRGGELPVAFARGTLMVSEFDQAAFALKPNEISDLVTTKAGYHIIKLLEKFPARRVTFDEVEARIKEYLSVQEAQKQLPDYLQKLRAASNVEILDPPTRR